MHANQEQQQQATAAAAAQTPITLQQVSALLQESLTVAFTAF